jgi:hypothetical protein
LQGASDDFNKCLWSALYLEPTTSADEVVAQYARHFLGGGSAAAGAALISGSGNVGLVLRRYFMLKNRIFAKTRQAREPLWKEKFGRKQKRRSFHCRLEENWEGDALANRHVSKTLAAAEQLDASSSVGKKPGSKPPPNWRLQAHTFRAFYDAFVQARAKWEIQIEGQVMEAIASAARSGVRKNAPFLKPFPPHTEYLPRQARDTHRKRRGKGVFSQAIVSSAAPAQQTARSILRSVFWRSVGMTQVRKRVFLRHLVLKSDRFAKTGSGQT